MGFFGKRQRPPEVRKEQKIRFVCEQDGMPERELKALLTPELVSSNVARAYLARVEYGVELPRISGHPDTPGTSFQAGGPMKPVRRHFTREFKLEAVRLVTTGGHSIGQVARDLDINETMLRRWRQEFAGDGAAAFPGRGRVSEEEVERLRRENARLREERDLLKKALAFFTRESA
jgi:transposase